MPEDHGWFVTATGRKVYVMDPGPEDVCIEDIAHALSHICRFGGHCKTFYSVAQHSVLVSKHVPAGLALEGLLHDATEAYVGDMIRPLKRQMPEYVEAENAWHEAIIARFGLLDGGRDVKLVDSRALMFEREVLGHERWMAWPWMEDEADIPKLEPEHWPGPLGPADAKLQFLNRYEALRRP